MIAIQRAHVASAHPPTGAFLAQPQRTLAEPIHSPPIALLGVPFKNVTRTEAGGGLEKRGPTRRPTSVVPPKAVFSVRQLATVDLNAILLTRTWRCATGQ